MLINIQEYKKDTSLFQVNNLSHISDRVNTFEILNIEEFAFAID